MSSARVIARENLLGLTVRMPVQGGWQRTLRVVSQQERLVGLALNPD
jgi:hypothetical protein